MHLSPKAAKMLVRLAVGGLSSAAIGSIIKAERDIEEKVEQHFDRKKKTEETDDPD